VPFHLGEHVLIVEIAAHGLQLPDQGNTFLSVPILGCNEKSSTSNQLIVALVNHTSRAISIEEVDGEEEGLGEKLKGGMSFDQEVNQIRTHEPLDFLLNINGSYVWQGLIL
jgi:hypothetical protein